MSVYIKENARFTVMCGGVIRMEYAENGEFEDRETLFAKRNALAESTVLDGDVFQISTEKVTLYYHGGEFSRETLYADINAGGMSLRWHFGDENKENLKGTLATLDGVNGFRPLPDGLLARDGWYVIDDSNSAVLEDGWAVNRSENHKIDIYLFAYGREYKTALKNLAEVSGKMAMPRKCFFGSWYSRWWDYSSEQFLEIIDGYDENGFPLDVLVMDMDWHIQDWRHKPGDPEYLYGYGHAGGNIGWTGYRWNHRLIPYPTEFISTVKQKGISVTLNDHPADGVRDTDEIYDSFMAELQEVGYEECVPPIEEHIKKKETENLCRNIKNFRFNAGNRDYMRAFFNATNKEIEERGADFRWLDWQQDYLYPEVNGVKGLTHLKWLNHLYYENSKRNGRRGLGFSRWGGFGDHKHPAYFSGDSVTSWETLAFEIQMTASAGNAGCFWWSHDIGGFEDPAPNGQAEVFARWVQFGAMSPALRVHMLGKVGLDRRPWTWPEPYASSMRKAYHLRSMLMPYIYSSAFISSRDSVPLLRPLYIDWNTEEAYNHPEAYMFGEGLYTAPITVAGNENGTAEVEIWLPDAIWYDYFSGKKYEGGTHKLSCSIDVFPLFAKAGYPIVMQEYTNRMTKSPLTTPEIHVYVGANGESEFYEDDGETENCGYRLTKISYTECEAGYEITVTPEGSGFAGEVQTRDLKIVLHGAMADKSDCATHETELVSKYNTVEITVRNVNAGDKLTVIAK